MRDTPGMGGGGGVDEGYCICAAKGRQPSSVRDRGVGGGGAGGHVPPNIFKIIRN